MGNTPRIIKAGQISFKPAEFNAADTLKETEERVEQARAHVEHLRQSAKEELEKLREQARREGHELGFADGFAKGAKEAAEQHQARLAAELSHRGESMLRALSETIAKLVEARDHWQAQWEQVGLSLACDIAERVLRARLVEPNATARSTLKDLLQLAGRLPAVTIYLSPIDAESLDLNAPQWVRATQSIDHLSVVVDPDMTPGGCRLESQFGELDANIETQLRRIRDELVGERDEHR